MYCSNCGQRLTDDAKHCPNCGVLIVRDGEERSDDLYKAEQPAPEQPGYTYGQASEPQGSGADPYARTDYGYGQAPAQDPYAHPYAAPPAPTKADGHALAGLILSIVSAVCCCLPFIGLPCAILGIIFAAKGLKSQSRHTMAMIALILGIIFAVCNAVALVSLILALANGDTWQEIFENMEDFNFDYYYRWH